MSSRLEGKVAIVTGAGRGIGKAIATAYGQNSAAVCCVARTLSQIRDTAAEIWVIYADGSNERVLISDVRVMPARASWQPVRSSK